jgi:hypothetical protein
MQLHVSPIVGGAMQLGATSGLLGCDRSSARAEQTRASAAPADSSSASTASR